MKNTWKCTGWYVFALGVIHTLFACFVFGEGLREIWNAGLFNGIGESHVANSAFWFLFCGLMLIYLGLHWIGQIRRDNRPLSAFTAWGMTGLTLVLFVCMPLSGALLMLPLCIIMLYPHISGSARSSLKSSQGENNNTIVKR